MKKNTVLLFVLMILVALTGSACKKAAQEQVAQPTVVQEQPVTQEENVDAQEGAAAPEEVTPEAAVSGSESAE